MRITVRVPATSANLGPGFDCFGLALDLCNEVTIDTEAEPGVSWEGEGVDELPIDGSDMVTTTIARVGALHELQVPPLHLHGLNKIPLERGLGSSSAAAVAGVVLGSRLFDLSIDGHDSSEGNDPYSVATLAAQIEGHPDNAAPAAFGGFTIATADGFVRRLDPHPDLRPVVLVPRSIRVPTSVARQALSPTVSRADAVFNAAHAALMVEALTRDPSLLVQAMRDQLHQAARLALVPPVAEVFRSLRDRNMPVCVSGAGPSLLAFELEGRDVLDPGEGWTVLRPGVRATGFEVSIER
ncbi:MAG TPA: homoserine kinase [Actinomycetota bacterium]